MISSLRKYSLSTMIMRLSQLMKKMMASRNQLHTLMMLSAELIRKMPDTASSRMLAHFFFSDTLAQTQMIDLTMYSTRSENETMQSVQKNLLWISSLPISRNKFMKNCSIRRSASGCFRYSLHRRVKIMMFLKSDQCRKNCHENSYSMLSSKKQSPSPYIRNFLCALPWAKCSGNTNLRLGHTLTIEQLEKISCDCAYISSQVMLSGFLGLTTSFLVMQISTSQGLMMYALFLICSRMQMEPSVRLSKGQIFWRVLEYIWKWLAEQIASSSESFRLIGYSFTQEARETNRSMSCDLLLQWNDATAQSYIQYSSMVSQAQLQPCLKKSQISPTDMSCQDTIDKNWPILLTKGGKLSELGGRQQCTLAISREDMSTVLANTQGCSQKVNMNLDKLLSSLCVVMTTILNLLKILTLS